MKGVLATCVEIKARICLYKLGKYIKWANYNYNIKETGQNWVREEMFESLFFIAKSLPVNLHKIEILWGRLILLLLWSKAEQ